MGLPIRHKTKSVSHKKKWDKNTIVEEAVIVTDYALKNKKEIRKVELQISNLKKIAKSLNRNAETKASQEAMNFIERLKAQGFLAQTATSLDEVLDITLRDVLERRLSNLVYKKGFARTPSQARQFVVHGHVTVEGVTITAPSHLVGVKEDATIAFVGSSSLADEAHPERKGPEAVEGLTAELEAQSEIPVKEESSEVDREAALDEEEQDEVKE